MNRHGERIEVFKILFESCFGKSAEDIIGFRHSVLLSDDSDYIIKTVRGVIENIDAIDLTIEKHSKGWKINRISKTCISVLRLCLFEILFCDDIPASVSANEAVEIAKEFEGDKAASFVNGIIGSVIKDKI